MKLRLQRKKTTAFMSAMVVGTVICTSAFMTNNTYAVTVTETRQAAAETSESVTSALTTSKIDKTTVVTTYDAGKADVTADKINKTVQKPLNDKSVSLWKANLYEYDDSCSLVSYEVVEVEKDKGSEEETRARGVIRNDLKEDSDSNNYYYYPDVNGATTLDVPEKEEFDPVSIASGNFAFTTYGYGHGVGLSQNGANFYATYGGMGYQDILQHYYPGTYIENTGTAQSEKITANGETGSVSDIVSRIVYTEIGSSMNTEAIKAQAIAIYTYIKYYGGNVDDLYPSSDTPPQNVMDAVNSVLGKALYYDGSFALTMFSASSGGSSASCSDIFYEDIPYLRSVPSEYDEQCDPHYGELEVISAETVKDELEAALGIKLSDDPSNWISVIEGDSGYAAYVVVDNQVTVKGNDFRFYLGLKSPKFTCTYY